MPLEKEYARRTKRLIRARNVPNRRSAWLVSPCSFAAKAVGAPGKSAFVG